MAAVFRGKLMRRQLGIALAAALACGAAIVLAQGGALSGVTMRVVDDLTGLDAVVIELDTSSREGA